jgi:hypothetical protein
MCRYKSTYQLSFYWLQCLVTAIFFISGFSVSFFTNFRTSTLAFPKHLMVCWYFDYSLLLNYPYESSKERKEISRTIFLVSSLSPQWHSNERVHLRKAWRKRKQSLTRGYKCIHSEKSASCNSISESTLF